ncbi:MAG: O-antigen ligase family protein [Chitinophagales bacterium]
MSHADNIHQGWRNLFLKSYMVIIPGALFCCDFIDEISGKKILKWYCVILFAACLFAIYNAFQNYSNTGISSAFLYHDLVSIYSGHAIQFSILVFVALLHLFELLQGKEFLFSKYFHFFLIPFFLIFLFLLSSKLVISFVFIYFLFVVIRSLRLKSVSKPFIFLSILVFIVFSSIILFSKNPINNRFKEIADTDFDFLKKEKYDPGLYFNGLQFRMLQWRFVPRILIEKKAWLTGVSLGDAQSDLDQKYISANIYIGTKARHDKGFIGYNTHNEFLESLLQTGIPGLLAFLLVTGALIKMILKQKKAELSFVTILLIIYSLNESVLESQYSLYIFLFFPAFFYLNKKGYGR